MKKIIKDLTKATEQPTAITKILMDIGYSYGYRPYIMKAINSILNWFLHCCEELEEFESFSTQSKEEQRKMLYAMLDIILVDLSFEELLEWVAIGNNKCLVDEVIKDCIENKKRYKFEEVSELTYYKLLEITYYKFLNKIGVNLIEILTQHSE
jgi:hypothetical protein